MSRMKAIFLGGLKVLVPFIFTILLLYWFFWGLEGFFRTILFFFISESSYFYGLGWISALLLTIFFGLIIQISFINSLIDKLVSYLLKLPVIRTLYGMSSDFMTFLTKKGMKQGKMVRLDTPIGHVLGIMTQDQLPKSVGKESEAAVYVPMSYQIGGFTFIVTKDELKEIDLSVQEGIALTMTACISGNKSSTSKKM